MNIVASFYSRWTEKIFNGEKTIEFRKNLPVDFGAGDKIYLYETKKYGGTGAVVGECRVASVISVEDNNGRRPEFNAYPFIDYFFDNVICDYELAEHYRELKNEFSDFPDYKYGFVLRYAASEKDLESLRKSGKPLESSSFKNLVDMMKNDKDRKKSRMYIDECEKWLYEIGFCNRYGGTSYRYGFVLEDVIKYPNPIPITHFRDKYSNTIEKPPQSWMYTVD